MDTVLETAIKRLSAWHLIHTVEEPGMPPPSEEDVR
jgi:hypothetical protein